MNEYVKKVWMESISKNAKNRKVSGCPWQEKKINVYEKENNNNTDPGIIVSHMFSVDDGIA